jgi:hypothetical protein
VIVSALGFDDLLSRVRNLRAIERGNVAATLVLQRERALTAWQARRLASIETRQQHVAAAVVVERDQVARLRLAIADRRLAAARSRARDQRELSREPLAREATALDQLRWRARRMRQRPVRAPRRLVRLLPRRRNELLVWRGADHRRPARRAGRALQLHLTGISGYRTPQHSVEVGGFPDDLHTRGLASDTPGVEGVPEPTLESFCLTARLAARPRPTISRNGERGTARRRRRQGHVLASPPAADG